MRFHFIDHAGLSDNCMVGAAYRYRAAKSESVSDSDYYPLPESDSGCDYWFTDGCQCLVCTYIRESGHD